MFILNDFNTSVEKALDEIDPKWREYKGLIICGTHTPVDPEAQIKMITEARYSGLPFLGICFGHQLAAIEYARTVMGIPDATSEEFGKGTLIVKKLPELRVGLHKGESYWHNYEVVWDKWWQPSNFITCQYHPEYQSSKANPHPILVQFLKLCRGEDKELIDYIQHP